MTQQAKAFFRTNGKKLQASTFSFVLSLVTLLGLLSLLSWSTNTVQAESRRPLRKRVVAEVLNQKEYGLSLAPLPQTANDFEAMVIDWSNYSILYDFSYFNNVVALTADTSGQVWFGGFVAGSPGHGRLAYLDASQGMQSVSFPDSAEKNIEETLVFPKSRLT